MYPYPLLNRQLNIHCLLGEQSLGQPAFFDFSGVNPDLWQMDLQDQVSFQTYVEKGLKEQKALWGVAGYLEKRDSLLRDLPQMVSEQRYFHLGVDIILPNAATLYLPLAGVVQETGYEAGKGNFGGFILIKHQVDNLVFFSLWGHMDQTTLPAVGTRLEAGEAFGKLGFYDQNGDWFFHTHLQLLTERGLKDGYISKGYCRAEMLPIIDQICPSPLFLLKW